MLKFMNKILLIFAAFTLLFPLHSKAKTTLANREDVFAFAQSAFQAQVSLSEKARTIDEVDEIISPFFTAKAKSLFLEENLFSENELFITYGTDFPIYYIPFFTYSDETKVVWKNNNIYLFEFFPEKDDGPVSYESHYEGVRLTNDDGSWKIAEFLYNDIPQEVIHGEKQKQETAIHGENKFTYYQGKIVKSSLQVGLCRNPLEFFVKYGYCVTEQKIKIK